MESLSTVKSSSRLSRRRHPHSPIVAPRSWSFAESLSQNPSWHHGGIDEENFKISNMMSKQVISLPMHSELDRDQIKFICNKVNEFFKAQEN